MRQHWKMYFSIVIGFFCCHNTSSTQVISVSTSSLAIVHTRKHFSYQLLSRIVFFWMYRTMMYIPRSCDYNVNVHHVQPSLSLSSDTVIDLRQSLMWSNTYVTSRVCLCQWQRVHINFKKFLISVNTRSKRVEVFEMPQTMTTTTLCHMFATHGIPEQLHGILNSSSLSKWMESNTQDPLLTAPPQMVKPIGSSILSKKP